MQVFRYWWPRPQFSAFLVVLWMLLVNSMSPAQVIIGAFLGWMIPFVTQQYWPERPHFHNAGRLLLYLGHLLWDILKSNITVARLILRNPDQLQPAFIRFPVTLKDEFAITMLASTISLTPGTVSAGLSPDRRTLLIHALHVLDEEALIRHIQIRYEQPLKEILE